MSRDTILTFSYHIANDTWPDEHYRIAASASPDAHCVIAFWRHMERFNVRRSSYTLTSLRVTLSRDFSPERHSSIRNIHVKLRYPTSTLGRSRLCVSVYFYHTKQTYLTCNMVWLNPWQYTVNPAWIYIKSCFEKSCPFGFIISWRICSRVSYLLFYYLRFSLNLLASEFYI